jgi:hypothetical protein
MTMPLENVLQYQRVGIAPISFKSSPSLWWALRHAHGLGSKHEENFPAGGRFRNNCRVLDNCQRLWSVRSETVSIDAISIHFSTFMDLSAIISTLQRLSVPRMIFHASPENSTFPQPTLFFITNWNCQLQRLTSTSSCLPSV